MWYVIAACALIVSCSAQDDVQSVKSVKGGHGGRFQYNAGANLNRFYNTNNTQTQHGYGYNAQQNLTHQVNYEVGVCYIEVPTASLVLDPSRAPPGNGSRPDLSRIRTCCKGYIRNIHNFKICDPICSQECINGLCSAPETCTCFPDHVRNLAGICVATCPIGCQNGHCAGGECLCKEGFKLDSESKFCVPNCRENCGGFGNCTAPNTCECKSGYQPTPDGSCKPVCSHCDNGDCVAPNECRCRQGYVKDHRGDCIADCSSCTPNGPCDPSCRVPPAQPQPSGNHQAGPPTYYPINQLNPQPNQPNPQPNQPNYPYTRPQGYPYPNNEEVYYGNVQRGDNPYNPANQVAGQGPVCSKTCLNAVCAEGNRCICNTGYIADQSDPTASRCIPHCPGGCVNGVCSAPNFCICSAGYYKDFSVKGRQNCVKRIRRSVDFEAPINVAELLTFEIPDY